MLQKIKKIFQKLCNEKQVYPYKYVKAARPGISGKFPGKPHTEMHASCGTQ